MSVHNRPVRLASAAVGGLALIAGLGAFAPGAAGAAPALPAGYTALAGSVPPTTDPQSGGYTAASMAIQVALRPRDAAGLAGALAAAYTKGSPAYQRWLPAGQFDRRYAPAAAERQAVASFLTGAGLTVEASPSPFLIAATGSSARVTAAFHTTLRSYTSRLGTTYFQNSAPVALPAALAGDVQGVTGLTNTIRDAKQVIRPSRSRPASAGRPGVSCEAPYPTAAQQFANVNSGTPFPSGYGGGPSCSGLTPAQDNSIYGAPQAGPRGQGQGVTIGLFELSAYQHSDITTWAQNFYGRRYRPPLADVSIDGGPLAPQCPVGDTCPPGINGYSGDVEAAADIEMQLAIAPAVRKLIVYNAPNDYTGQTELDEWTAIANADQAASVSSSWALCENDATSGYVQAENTVFEQLALQGQSVFGAEGDTGAFSCIRSDGSTIVNVLDPPSQPYVTSVGGTSFESFNPGTSATPAYPKGTESVWNTDALCSDSGPAPANDNLGGFFWCGRTGAGGGASSQWWGRPSWQAGPGVGSPVSTTGNGSTHCALASAGTPCREDPDISADADEFTPYAEYCTGNAGTPLSECGTFSGSQPSPGWFGIGGTSLAAPLWSAIIADRDSFFGRRNGNIAPLLYLLAKTFPGVYFHDITGAGQTTTDNGLFPVTPGYDEATGLGSPRMTSLITRSLFS
jgi:subtilase family serine protease